MNPSLKSPTRPIFALKEKELHEHALGEDIRPDIELPEDHRHLFSDGLVCGRRHQALVSDDIAFSGTNLRFILKKIKKHNKSTMFQN